LSNEEQNGFIRPADSNMSMAELTSSKKYTIVSFMIFRTGSVLIVGNCSEYILNHIYLFITNLLETEYNEIYMIGDEAVVKDKRIKIRKRFVTITSDYLKNKVM
jgi:hypothetical protein